MAGCPAPGAGTAVLTHIRPLNDRDEVLEQASATYDGELSVAREGMEVEV